MTDKPVEIRASEIVAEVYGETKKEERIAMDFNSKKFWVAQIIAAIITVVMFIGNITFGDWFTYIGMLEGGWGILDVSADFVKAKTNGGNTNG